MDYKQRATVFVATKSELKQNIYYRRLWMATRSIIIPRRQWLDEIADTLRDFDGIILTANRKQFDIPNIDEVFGDDPDMRWMGYYLQPDSTGQYPKMRTYKIKRLQIIDLYFRIKHPLIARHFGR